jgi:tight adherence protein C
MDILMQNLQGSLDNPEALILLSMFLAVVLLIMGGAGVFAGGNPVKQRLKTRVRRVETGATREQRGGNIVKVGKGIARKMEKKQSENDSGKTNALRRKLIMAGYLGSSAVSIFLLFRIVAAAAAPIVTLLAIPYIAGSPPPATLAICGVIAAAIGFYLPSLWVAHRTGARQEEARQGFPDALDMLLVCVEAGLSLAAALNRVGQEIGQARPLLGEQFRLVALEMQAGKSREQALRNLAERIGINEVRSLVTLLLQSESLGTSIGLSLRVHAEEMRRKRLVKAEEKGNKLPTKMAIPLICFILPSLMSVVLTPLIITFIRVLGPAMSGQ